MLRSDTSGYSSCRINICTHTKYFPPPATVVSPAIAGVLAAGGDPSTACVPDLAGHKIVNSLLLQLFNTAVVTVTYFFSYSHVF